jgi:hypothetical protein
VMALDNLIQGRATDLGGIYLVPQTIANALGGRFKKEYLGPIKLLFYGPFRSISPKEMAIRYELFLLQNPEFPDDFKAKELKNYFINTQLEPRLSGGKSGIDYAYTLAFQRQHGRINTPDLRSAFNTEIRNSVLYFGIKCNVFSHFGGG